jgi:hypothetical protein
MIGKDKLNQRERSCENYFDIELGDKKILRRYAD